MAGYLLLKLNKNKNNYGFLGIRNNELYTDYNVNDGAKFYSFEEAKPYINKLVKAGFEVRLWGTGDFSKDNSKFGKNPFTKIIKENKNMQEKTKKLSESIKERVLEKRLGKPEIQENSYHAEEHEGKWVIKDEAGYIMTTDKFDTKEEAEADIAKHGQPKEQTLPVENARVKRVVESLNKVSKILKDRATEKGWLNLSKKEIDKKIKELQKKGWYDEYTLDMTLLHHLKDVGNTFSESKINEGNYDYDNAWLGFCKNVKRHSTGEEVSIEDAIETELDNLVYTSDIINVWKDMPGNLGSRINEITDLMQQDIQEGAYDDIDFISNLDESKMNEISGKLAESLYNVNGLGQVNDAEYTDRVDTSFEITLGDYGIARNPKTDEVIYGCAANDQGGYGAFDTTFISLEDVKEVLEDIEDGFFDFIGSDRKTELNKLDNENLAIIIHSINSYGNYFNMGVYSVDNTDEPVQYVENYKGKKSVNEVNRWATEGEVSDDDYLDTFEYIYSSLVNGNISQYKKQLKRLANEGALREYQSWAEEMGVDPKIVRFLESYKGRKSMKKSVNEDRNYRGLEDIKFIWHGTNSDPELVYKGHSFNYYDVEDALYNMCKEDIEEGIFDGNANNDEDFERWLQDNKGSIYGMLDDWMNPVESLKLSRRRKSVNEISIEKAKAATEARKQRMAGLGSKYGGEVLRDYRSTRDKRVKPSKLSHDEMTALADKWYDSQRKYLKDKNLLAKKQAQNESLSQSILRDAHSVLTMNESEAGEMTTWQFTARGFSKAMINKQPVFGSDNIRCIIHENANGKVVGTAVVDYYMSEAQVEEAIKKALAENGFRASNITNLVNLF